MLFLLRGDFPHERTWAAWFADAQGLVAHVRSSRRMLRRGTGRGRCSACPRRFCQQQGSGKPAVGCGCGEAQQHGRCTGAESGCRRQGPRCRWQQEAANGAPAAGNGSGSGAHQQCGGHPGAGWKLRHLCGVRIARQFYLTQLGQWRPVHICGCLAHMLKLQQPAETASLARVCRTCSACMRTRRPSTRATRTATCCVGWRSPTECRCPSTDASPVAATTAGCSDYVISSWRENRHDPFRRRPESCRECHQSA